MKRSPRISFPLVQLGQGSYTRELHASALPALSWRKHLGWVLLVLAFICGFVLGVIL